MLFTTKLNMVNTLKILSIFLSINVINVINKKHKVDDKINLIYIIFIILAHFMGVILNLYDKILYYDKFVHFLFGMVSTYILINLINIKCKKIIVINITMFLATMWEMYEYLCSILFKVDPQNNLTTGVHDTMQDLIVALIGSIIVSIIYNNKR